MRYQIWFWLFGLAWLFTKIATSLAVPADASLLEWIAVGNDLDEPVGAGQISYWTALQAWLAWTGFQAGDLRLAGIFRELPGLVIAAGSLLLLWFLNRLCLRFDSSLRNVAAIVSICLVAGLFFLQTARVVRWISSPKVHEQVRMSANLRYLAELAAASAEREGGSVWMNPDAARYLGFLAPGLATEPLEVLQKTAIDPVVWRFAERAANYRTVLLTSPHSVHRALLDHLVASGDWAPTAIEPFGLLFEKKPANQADLSLQRDPETAAQKLEDPEAKGVYLARVAGQWDALGEPAIARRFYRSALASAPDRLDVLALYASFLASREQWSDARKVAEEILEKAPDYPPALQVLIQSELAADRPAIAWRYARNLADLEPNDPFSLFLAAKAANAAGAFWAEQELLEELVRVSSRRGHPVANYRIYLGQALARQGFAVQAESEWKLAENSGELSDSQLAMLRELRKTLSQHASPENPLPTTNAVR